ncbi:MAG: hypothetical protein ABR511_11290 [Acidimicrobiales bacterium]
MERDDDLLVVPEDRPSGDDGPPDPRARPAGRLGRAEWLALAMVGAALVAFGAYGAATGAPSTWAYELTVAVLAAAVVRLWEPAMPGVVAVGLALLAVAHLAGGLVRVGDDVLYNAWLGSPAVRYDHLVHTCGVFLGTLTLWLSFVPADVDARRRRDLVAVWVLAGLGLGALNETIEFLSTAAHHGAHVGGYTNTGWDLVSNVVGVVAAGALLVATGRPRGRTGAGRAA